MGFCREYLQQHPDYYLVPLKLNGSAVETLFSQFKYNAGGKLTSLNFATAKRSVMLKRNIHGHHSAAHGYRDVPLYTHQVPLVRNKACRQVDFNNWNTRIWYNICCIEMLPRDITVEHVWGEPCIERQTSFRKTSKLFCSYGISFNGNQSSRPPLLWDCFWAKGTFSTQVTLYIIILDNWKSKAHLYIARLWCENIYKLCFSTCMVKLINISYIRFNM